jgi:diguanylate cyclase (GGDEF)-like protein
LNGRAYGVLHLSFTAPRRPPPGFGELLTRLTEQAAAALHSAGRLETARRQANTDSLTGAPNRRALFERLENELRRASRYQRPFTLFMLDLNDFKRINDTYGHPAGDLALQQVAECLRRGLRETDFLARYGGDEFTILLPETDAATARSLADRLLERLRDCPLDPSGQAGALSVSLGMASFPQDGVTSAGLIIAADRALYEVKFQRNAKLERPGRCLE